MAGPRGERCDRCYFGTDNNPDDPNLTFWCNRYPPPEPYREDGTVMADEPFTHPTVFPSQWCGEFKPRSEE